MAPVKIDDKLLKEIRECLEENGYRYKHPTTKSFVTNAVYEKLEKEKNNDIKG